MHFFFISFVALLPHCQVDFPSCPALLALAVTRSSQFIVSLGFMYHTYLAWYLRETFQVRLEALCSAFLSYHNDTQAHDGFWQIGLFFICRSSIHFPYN